MDFFFDSKCKPGKKMENGACADTDTQLEEWNQGVSSPCKTGMYTSGTLITTHGTQKQCMHCPDLMACNLAKLQPNSQNQN